jgi:hypothetical protein
VTTRHLFLLFPAYLLAVYGAAFWDSGKRVHYRYFGAVIDIDYAYRSVLALDQRNVRKVATEETINQWLDHTLSAEHWVSKELVERIELDPWGSPYKCVRNRTLDNGTVVPMGIFSMGRDGVSRSEGNDPDDLNSWDARSGDYYRLEIAAANRKQYAIEGAYLTPFTYAALLLVIAGCKRFWRRPPFHCSSTVGGE